MAVNERTALLIGNNQSHKNGTHMVHIVDLPFDNKGYEEIYSDYDISSALSLEELLPYKDDVWWKNLRRSIFVSFWLTLLLTFIVACGLSYMQMGSCKIMSPNADMLTGVAPANIETISKLLAP